MKAPTRRLVFLATEIGSRSRCNCDGLIHRQRLTGKEPVATNQQLGARVPHGFRKNAARSYRMDMAARKGRLLTAHH